MADFSVQGGTVTLADNAQPRPVALDLTALGITARNLASDGSKPEAFTLTARAAAPGKGSTLTADSYISIAFEAGTLTAGGTATFTYYTSLDNRDIATIIGEISAAENKSFRYIGSAFG